MQKRVLVVASVISFIEWFNRENITFLREMLGCEVHIACNLDYMDDTDAVRTREYIEKLRGEGVILHNIDFARSPFSLQNVNAYKKLQALIESGYFDLIHCHTPTVSMMTRIAARKVRRKGTVVMYTCHGFHFHKASSRINWVLYYPVERFLSRYCDYLVTINREDYARAKTFHCGNVRYIPSVGVDLERIWNITLDREEKKRSIGVPEGKQLMISAGELIARKNHEVIIRALAKVADSNIYYAIAGKGPLEGYLKALAEELNVADRVLFLGFRTDIYELYHAADFSAFPSKIEGLGMAGIEALAAGLPLIASNVHGILDYVIDGETGYAVSPTDVNGFADAIQTLAKDDALRETMRKKCIKAAEPFECKHALAVMWEIYAEILKSDER